MVMSLLLLLFLLFLIASLTNFSVISFGRKLQPLLFIIGVSDNDIEASLYKI